MLRFAKLDLWGMVRRSKGEGMIHFVSGKGGVGKSTVAAAFAWNLASQGRKTLLIELGERSYLRHLFQSEVSGVPVAITTHLSLARWEGEGCLRDYLHHLVRVERLVQLFFDNKVMRSLIQAAPALRELALLGKITSGIRHVGPAMLFDDLVVDGYATGHFRAMWRAPAGLAEAIPFGPMGEQSRAIVSVLKNPEQCRFHVVMIPEELPVTEGLELARDIRSELQQSPQLYLNRWLECQLTPSQLRRFEGHEFASYLGCLLERQDEMEQKLLAGEVIDKLPWLFVENVSEKTRQLASFVRVRGSAA